MATEPVEAAALDIAVLAATTAAAEAAALDVAVLATDKATVEAVALDIALLAPPDLRVGAAALTIAVIAVLPPVCPEPRTVQEFLDRLFAFLPPEYESAEPILAGIAAAQREGEGAALCMQDVLPFGPMTVTLPDGSTIDYGGATDVWLDLHAAGYGLSRTPNETDESLRTRLREVTERITRPSILAAVDLIIAPFGVTATMVEWFEEPYLDLVETVAVGGMYLDSTLLSGGPNTFVLYVPVIGVGYANPIYDSIIAAVESLRAAGIQWRLVVGDPPP